MNHLEKSSANHQVQAERIEPGLAPVMQRKVPTGRAPLSLSLSSEILNIRVELVKVTVMPVISGFVNEKSMLEVISSIVNYSIANSITSVNDYTFLVPLASIAEVKEVCKMDTMKISTKDRECILKTAPWTAELGADDKVTGAG